MCALPACKTIQEETQPEITQLSAVLEEESDTKTTLSPGMNGVSQVLWSEGDQISVFMDGSSRAVPFKLAQGAGTKRAYFLGEGMAKHYVAFYPPSMVPSMSGETIRLTLPGEQTYVAGSFAGGTFPMAAASNSSDLSFKNTASILRVSLTGRHEVTRIVFRSKDKSVKVSGRATVSMEDPSQPVLKVASDGCDSLVLTTGGVKLQETQPTDFYLVLPAQTYKGGFVVRVYTKSRYMDKEYTRDFTMERGKLHKADTFTFEPGGIDESTYLEGSGTESDPFLIQSLSDLILMRDAVNNGGSILTAAASPVKAGTAFYLLSTDIDLRPVCSEEGKMSWTPVGNVDNPFNGVFSGQGHKVENLYIKATGSNIGFFGYIGNKGEIRSLSVQGKITGQSFNYVGMVAGYSDGPLSNCFSYGEVNMKGGSYTGGIVGDGNDVNISECVNYASVTGGNFTAGIVGTTYGTILKCINHGDVSGEYLTGGIAGDSNSVWASFNEGTVKGNKQVGGIVGYHNYGYVLSCMNEGNVIGISDVGGITGYSRQGACVWNHVNRGDISGSDNVGGICGFLSNNSSAWGEGCTLKNCVNIGSVSSTGTSGSAGAICGFNEGEDTQREFLGSAVEQCYWLYDSGKGLGIEKGIGKNEGASSQLFSLTQAQMKGEDTGKVLYEPSYSKLSDALNAFSFAEKWILREAFRMLMLGWEYSDKDGYVRLTGLEVQQPGNEQPVFTVSPKSVEIKEAEVSTFEVEVVSTLDYSLEKPDWIETSDVLSFETDRYTRRYVFKTSANNGTDERSGQIRFTNSEGTVQSVKVSQPGRYLEVNTETLVYTGSGGALRFGITSSLAWTVESDASWCSVAPAYGHGNGIISVSAEANTGSTARSATVTVHSADGSLLRTVTAVQGAASEGGEQEVDWTQYEFVHKSIVLRYTATWCGWCPRMNKTIQRAQELAPDTFNYMVLHDGGSDLQFSQAGPLASQFSFTGFPTGMVDGRVEVGNGDIEPTARRFIAAVEETTKTYGTVTGADISSTISGSTVRVDVGVYVKEPGQYKLTVFLLEDAIINPQTDYEEGDHSRYVHDNIIRVAMSDVLGDSFTVSSAPFKQVFNYSASVPSSCELANMRVLVYIQRQFGSYPVIQSGNYGSFFIDNSAAVVVGESLKLALVDAPAGGGGSQEGGDNEGITTGDDIDM